MRKTFSTSDMSSQFYYITIPNIHMRFDVIIKLCSIGTLPDVSITDTTSTDTSITVNIGNITSGIARIIIGYHRLILGVPVVGEYGNNRKTSTSRTFSSLVPGAKYRITAWGLGGSDDRRTSQSPSLREVTTMEQSELMQWSLNWAHKQCAHITNQWINVYNISYMYIPHRSISSKIPH